MASSPDDDRDPAPAPTTTPSLIRVFCRPHAFPRSQELSSSSSRFSRDNGSVQAHVYAYRGCTLAELSHLLADAAPGPLRHSLTVGTRLVFRIAVQSTPGVATRVDGGHRPMSMSPPHHRYTARDLGSVVIRARKASKAGRPVVGGSSGGSSSSSSSRKRKREEEDGDRAEDGHGRKERRHSARRAEEVDDDGNSGATEDEAQDEGEIEDGLGEEEEAADDASMTLADAHFVPGDVLTCAILPPSPVTGAVKPASAANVPPPPPRLYRNLHDDRNDAGYVDSNGNSSGRNEGAFRSGGYYGGGRGRGRGLGYGLREEADHPRGRYRSSREYGGSGEGGAGAGGGTGKRDFGWLGGSSSSTRVPEGEWRRGERLPHHPATLTGSFRRAA